MKRNCLAARGLLALVLPFGFAAVLAARSATPSAFERRCIPSRPQRGCRVGGPGPGGVAPPSNTPGILGRRALPDGRIAALGATMELHHGLLAQIDPRTALLERGAWNALTAGQAHVAAEAFREAIAADPKNARLHLGAGMAASLERRDGDAKDALERALTLDPKLMQARALLGQIQRRMGDISAAIRTYETLLTMTPDDREAEATLDRWQREAALHDRMQQA